MEKGQDRGFVLHSRRFRENSRILELFTRNHGRVSVLGRVPRKQAIKKTLLFQPFIEVDVSWRGRGELLNLTSIEEALPIRLRGKRALCGLYCNELLLYSLGKFISAPELYKHYKRTLSGLSAEKPPEPCLREFEHFLLEEAGQGLDFYTDYKTGQQLELDGVIFFQPGYGFSIEKPAGKVVELNAIDMKMLQSGKLALESREKGVKMVYQAAIRHMLQNKELRSRQLFKEVNKLNATE